MIQLIINKINNNMKENKKKYKQSLYQSNREKWAKIENGYRKKKAGLPLKDDELDDYCHAGISHFGFNPFE